MAGEKEKRSRVPGEQGAAPEEELRSHVGLERVAELDAELEPGVGVGEAGADIEARGETATVPEHRIPVPAAPMGKSMRVLATTLHAHRVSSSPRPATARRRATKPEGSPDASTPAPEGSSRRRRST